MHKVSIYSYSDAICNVAKFYATQSYLIKTPRRWIRTCSCVGFCCSDVFHRSPSHFFPNVTRSALERHQELHVVRIYVPSIRMCAHITLPSPISLPFYQMALSLSLASCRLLLTARGHTFNSEQMRPSTWRHGAPPAQVAPPGGPLSRLTAEWALECHYGTSCGCNILIYTSTTSAGSVYLRAEPPPPC